MARGGQRHPCPPGVGRPFVESDEARVPRVVGSWCRGLVAAWFDARRASGEAARRRRAEQAINTTYGDAVATLSGLLRGEGSHSDVGVTNALEPFLAAVRETAQLPPAAGADNDLTGAQSAERFAAPVLRGVRRDLLYVGTGTLASTIASLWAMAA